jgi:DNA gyrase/topoisomerase IV subunit A
VPTAENRQQLNDRLAVLAPMARATNDAEGLIDALSSAIDEAAATAALRDLLECDDLPAVAVLGMQVRRFAVQERQRMSGELESIRAELEDPPAPDVAPEPRPPGSRLVQMTARTIDSPPLSVAERERRRSEAPAQRRLMFRALIQACDEVRQVLDVVSSSDTAASSNEALQARFGWDFIQALTVLDMQLRLLTPFGRKKLVDVMADEN